MSFLVSSYDNALSSNTQQREIPCQHFEVALFPRKNNKRGERKDYASDHAALTFSAKKITTMQKRMFCSNTKLTGSC